MNARAAGPPGRAPARRPAARRRARILVLVGVVVVLGLITWGASISPLLDVDHVQVRGLDRLTAAQVEDAAGVHRGDPIVWLDEGKATTDVEALPYVGRAEVVREWPDTVRIVVHERLPVAWVDGPAGKSVVDGTGRVLEVVDAPPAGLPQLLGTKVVPPVGGTIAPVDGARVAGGLTGFAAGGTTSVEVTDKGVLLHLTSGPEIRMGAATQIAVKVRAAIAVLAASTDVEVHYVDVSVPTNPVSGLSRVWGDGGVDHSMLRE